MRKPRSNWWRARTPILWPGKGKNGLLETTVWTCPVLPMARGQSSAQCMWVNWMYPSGEFGAWSHVFISRQLNPGCLTDFLNYLLLISSLLACARALCNFKWCLHNDRKRFRVMAVAKAKVRSLIILKKLTSCFAKKLKEINLTTILHEIVLSSLFPLSRHVGRYTFNTFLS